MRVGHSPSFAHLALALALVACKKASDSSETAPSASVSELPRVVPLPERPVSGEAAFDLVTAGDGAAVAWGRPTKDGAEVAIAFTDANGAQRGEPVVVTTPTREPHGVVEVALANTGSRLGVAWLAERDRTATVWGAVGDPATRSFAPASVVLDSTLGDASQRGHVLVAANDQGELMAFARGPDEPCPLDHARTCESFGFRTLSPGGPERRGFPLAVPAACARPLVGLALIGDRWHYAVCSEEDGTPTVTAFNVQRSPYYAEAKKLLAGCSPLGMTVVGSDVLIAGDCPDGRRAMRFGGMNDPVTSIELDKSELACERGRPVLKALGSPPLVLTLDTPRDGLAPLLPPLIAPRNARAIWTGTNLLVASWVQKKLVMRRYACRDGELVQS